MNFISQNVFLIIIALASGGMLLWQAIRGGGGTALGALAATQLINQKGAQVADLRDDLDFLKASGRSEVYSLEGGIDAWQQAGLPLVNPKDKA